MVLDSASLGSFNIEPENYSLFSLLLGFLYSVQNV